MKFAAIARFLVCLYATGLLATSASLEGRSTAHDRSAAAFRGLDGSSRRADVLKVFPNAAVNSLCSPGEAVGKGGGEIYSCATLNASGYQIANRAFAVGFLFNVDGSLKAVVLSTFLGSGRGTQNTGVPKDETRNFFVLMSDLLSSRFGVPLPEDPRLSREFPDVETLSWFPDKRTGLKGDKVELKGRNTKNPNQLDTYFGTVSVTYSYVSRRDQSKL